MSYANKIALIREMLGSAEASLRSAQQLLADIPNAGSTETPNTKYSSLAAQSGAAVTGRIVEGIFNGEKMIDSEANEYPVPANYASKSKLVEGDMLKLTITDDGRFLYKQIAPVPRRTVIGPLTYEGGKYKVMAEGHVYTVLLASVTFYRAEIGDNVTIIVPENGEAVWGAIDNVLPKNLSTDELEPETESEDGDLDLPDEK